MTTADIHSVRGGVGSTGNSGLVPAWRKLFGPKEWPMTLFLLVWFVVVLVPLGGMVVYSFFETKSFFTVYEFSLNTWFSIFESGRFEVTLRTLRIALTVTVIELLIAFPFALWLSKGSASKIVKAVVLALLTIPFFLDISSRTIIWRAILGENGLINSALMSMGMIDGPIRELLYTEWSVHFGMLITYFPTMVLPIYLGINVIDDTLIEASNDLGGTPWHTLAHVIIPLSIPGVIAGVVFTLGPALAAWVEPSMLGGGFVNLLSNSVESAYTALKYPVVAALSSLIILLLAVLVACLAWVSRRFGDLSSAFQVLKG